MFQRQLRRELDGGGARRVCVSRQRNRSQVSLHQAMLSLSAERDFSGRSPDGTRDGSLVNNLSR